MTTDHQPSTRRADLSWILTLFGTAVGAGILFLPISAGLAGFWVSLCLAVIVYPIIYLAHSFYAGVVFHTPEPCDYTCAVSEWLGPRAGVVISVLFSTMLLMLLLTYTTALNNSVGEFLMDQHITSSNPARAPFLSLGILAAFLALLRLGDKLLVRVLGVLSGLLILILLAISVLMIPYWSFESIAHIPAPAEGIRGGLRLFPILIQSFSFYPAVSSMAIAFRRTHDTLGAAESRGARIIRGATFALVLFTMLFVFSCVFALGRSELAQANAKNLSALDMLGIGAKAPLLAELGPLVSIVALTTSFFGIFLGYRESVLRLVGSGRKDDATLRTIILTATMAVLWLFANLNLSVITILGEVGGPLTALFLFLIPAAIYAKHSTVLSARPWTLALAFGAGVVMVLAYGLAKI